MNGAAARVTTPVPLRLGRTGWALLLVAALAAAWYAGLFAAVRQALQALASQPDVVDAFTDPEHGRLDALLLIISFLLLAPFALLIGLLAVVFAVIVVSLLLEPLLQTARVPGWTSLPLVLLATAWTAWALRDGWAPQAVHLAALIARAWVVYFSSGPTLPP